MPGPRNWKRQKKRNGLKEKKRQAGNEPVATPVIGGSLAPPDPAPQVEEREDVVTRPVDVELGAESDELGVGLLGEPPIYDPGTGPRVKSMGEFLRSSFASEPTWDDELCAEFAQEEMLEMLREVLPEEMALCVWYNKSRRLSRVCPACWRIFQTGEVLSSPLEGLELAQVPDKVYPELVAEQGISGLCSTVCFVLASLNYPEGIRVIFGKSAAEEINWDSLSTVGRNLTNDDGGLSMILRMTRQDDLGLGQLLFQ